MYAIGLGENKDEILKAVEKLEEEGIDIELIRDPKRLVDKLIRGEIEGAVRGSLPSSKVIPYLKSKIGKFYRTSILKNPFTGDIFLLSPVGIDDISEEEEERVKDKIKIINLASNFLRSVGIEPKVALLSGGRLGDLGRSKTVDRTILEAELVLNHIKKKNKNLEIDHRGILIEEYLKEGYNIIIPMDGISGNLIFRCLALVCRVSGCGAIILSEKNVKFIDTSRNADWRRYYNAIKFLHDLNVKNGKLTKY
ncbi:methanogen marker protein 4 [Methanocaldococcus vulcanius M7]|uniref:Methanogen marker protein 4 n=1 Tax=Methanocaldococcus vulcanius (strain ATCC 700851 / DSM 12094 / M7) TaxID=579137 RepID=C9RG85_METVM|nr:methanogenesis marker protein Mmp4/MtxX [Methanocaldococcus vulcanius]ACX72587.1 methanogen marker protein 4 [Methanocaldococcus vulcanius M7]